MPVWIIGALSGLTVGFLTSVINLLMLTKKTTCQRMIAQLVESIAHDPAVRESIEVHIDEADFDSELSGIVDERLDRMIQGLTTQIPLAAMFLDDKMTGKIKGIAKAEIAGAIPSIKKRLVEKVVKGGMIEALIKDQCENINLRTMINLSMIRPVVVIPSCIGALIGFFMTYLFL